MKVSEIKSLVELLAYLMVGFLPLLGVANSDDEMQTIIYLTIAAMGFSYFAVRLYGMIKQRQLETNSMSNNSVIKRARKYCKSLLKYAKASQKKMLVKSTVRDLKRTRDEQQRILTIITSKQHKQKKAVKVNKRIEQLTKKYTDHRTVNLIKSLSEPQDYAISQLLSDTFVRLERVLLNAEQFDLRIRFGKYIFDFSDRVCHRIKATIEFLGWTYMMMGDIKKGEKAILNGIGMAKLEISNSTNLAFIEEMNFYICRGYRHLGSARSTYEKNPDDAILHLKNAIDYYKLLNQDNTDKKSDYQQMMVGIDYGIATSELYRFINKKKDNKHTDKAYTELYDSFNSYQKYIEISKHFSNPHRYVKFLMLNVKHYEIFLNDYDQMIKHLGEKFTISKDTLKHEIKTRLADVESVFKNNIFMDEAVEHYLEENVKFIKYELIDALKEETE